jgi:hypothetical protein
MNGLLEEEVYEMAHLEILPPAHKTMMVCGESPA